MKILFCVSLMLSLLAPVFLPAAALSGDWRVNHLDDRTLVLAGDYADDIQKAYQENRMGLLREWFRKMGRNWKVAAGVGAFGSEAIGQIRPRVAEGLQQFDRIAVTDGEGKKAELGQCGYWLNPIGAARFPDTAGKEMITRNADVMHYLFLRFAKPLKPGETYRIALPTGERIDYRYEPEKNASSLFKYNQLGYMPQAGRKYAYLGAWLGDAGPLPMKEFLGKPFELCDEATGKVVFSGKVEPRIPDPVSKEGVPFTGEETAELDFSKFSTPGTYFLRVAGIGRSEPFRLGGESVAEAFYIHARGLYHKRCGIAKEKPYTNWTVPICHTEVVRGTFPPDDGHYRAARKGTERDWGFFDDQGKSITVKHFDLIGQNAPPAGAEKLKLPGGWHDAADYDRRPYHFSIVGDLAAAYLIRPKNFSDGQLNIPESGNGIPDILDEARYGLEHLRLAQQADGGVGTWIETDHHPRADEHLPSSPQAPFQLSLATRGSSLQYAAYAALLAVALREAGAEKESALYRESARRAWEFALNPANRQIRRYTYRSGKAPAREITYREPADLPPEYLLKAAANLFLLYGDMKYLDPLEGMEDKFIATMKKDSWSWSPFFLIELELFPRLGPVLGKLWKPVRESLLRQAKEGLKTLEENYPYRIPWYGPTDWRVSTMSWGTYHPLRRALTFLAAHAISGDRQFLDAAYLCNDFHNGANPNGMTMTSGLGRNYPVRFLDLTSYADGIPEFVPGITPYRNTYGIAADDARLAHGLYSAPRGDLGFAGLSQSLVPLSLSGGKALTEDETRGIIGKNWPIWRRWANLEGFSVPASEYTVWETMAPAAVATGLLLDRPYAPTPEQLNRVSVDDIRKLPGYAPLP